MSKGMGNKYGTHRVLGGESLLPQGAKKIDNTMEIYDNEILIDVDALNIDSASFRQLWEASGENLDKLKQAILDIVADKGKMQNPVTGSGGMLIGRVAQIGAALQGRDLKLGDKLATLVSLSLTPLKIEEITAIYPDIDRVEIKGQAILFESGIYAKLPEDLAENLALAALDVCGAPAQVAKIVKPGDSVLILGSGGKSGKLCCYEAKKRVGPTGRVVGLDYFSNPQGAGARGKKFLEDNNLVDAYILEDAQKPVEVLTKALEANNGQEYDICICVVNVEGAEMSAILPVKDKGIVYFFSMATSFTRAALGAEGVGKDVTMVIGNGYTQGHAEITLSLLRESEALRQVFEAEYV